MDDRSIRLVSERSARLLHDVIEAHAQSLDEAQVAAQRHLLVPLVIGASRALASFAAALVCSACHGPIESNDGLAWGREPMNFLDVSLSGGYGAFIDPIGDDPSGHDLRLCESCAMRMCRTLGLERVIFEHHSSTVCRCSDRPHETLIIDDGFRDPFPFPAPCRCELCLRIRADDEAAPAASVTATDDDDGAEGEA